MIKETKIILNDPTSVDMPLFIFDGEYISISGKALPEFAPLAWKPFLDKLREHILTISKVTVDFKLDYYNSASSRFITDMFTILDQNRLKCTPIINWYYFKLDEDTMADGEMWKDTFKRLNIALIEKSLT